jgi:non-homologous end joining protein Ku
MPAKDLASWRGAVEFAGFPINVTLYKRHRTIRTDSFKTIAPSGKPMKSGPPIDSATDQPYDKTLSRKGVPIGNDEYVVLTDTMLTTIADAEKTRVAKVDRFCPLDTIALDLAIDRFAVRPDDKVVGSDGATNILWNGLRTTGLAYVSQVALRNGGMDGLLVIYADDRGLWAALLPFVDELYSVPTHSFTEDENASALFGKVVAQTYHVGPFEHDSYTSHYKERRQEIIDAAIAGREIVEAKPEPAKAVVDLMAIMAASITDTDSAPAQAQEIAA